VDKNVNKPVTLASHWARALGGFSGELAVIAF
jgi:hypothetical protein